MLHTLRLGAWAKIIRQPRHVPMASALVALGAGWTPEEAARSQVELLRGLAADPKTQRLYLRKVQIVEAMRAKTTAGKA
jgi:hypothetical protein